QQHKPPRQLPIENALDDIGHQGCLGRIVLGDGLAVRTYFAYSIDAWIGEINGLTTIVDQVASSRTTFRAGLMPTTIEVGDHISLGFLQVFGRTCLGGIDF